MHLKGQASQGNTCPNWGLTPIDSRGILEGNIDIDFTKAGKPVIGYLNEQLSKEISKLPLPNKVEAILQGVNTGYGVIIDKVADNAKK